MQKPVALLRRFLLWMVNWSKRFELELLISSGILWQQCFGQTIPHSLSCKWESYSRFGLHTTWLISDKGSHITRCETWQMVFPGCLCADLQQKKQRKYVKLLAHIWVQQGWHGNWNRYWKAYPMYSGRNFKLLFCSMWISSYWDCVRRAPVDDSEGEREKRRAV